jgi:hypothetical protein
LDRAEKAWEFKGKLERLVMDHESGNVFAICRDAHKTTLVTIDPKGNTTQKELLSKPYQLDATVANGKVWIACNQVFEGSKQKDVTDVFAYDMKTEKIEKKLSTDYAPTHIQVVGDMMYAISGSNEPTFLESRNVKTGKSKKRMILRMKNIFGFVANGKGQFVFADAGVFQAENTGMKMNTEFEERSDSMQRKIIH